MAGGRIGKDGIHGATFSSEELHQDSPVQAVQIGDPITQKKMSDFLIEARDAGLYRVLTDNGAGGLSSSIGEMATGPGGAAVDLSRAPLKYAGLQPWEVWLSEAQERMTLAVEPGKMEALRALAARRDVELSDLGAFDDSGYLTLTWGEEVVGRLSMAFLHDGCPRLELKARWEAPRFAEARVADGDLSGELRELMGRLNLCSKEEKMRQYDHEVKGRTVVKPLVGVGRDVPSDGTVFLAEYGGREGIVLASAFNAHLSDVDAGAMMAWTVDLAVRRVLAVGGRLDFIAGLDNFCWPDPVESAATPDGQYKMAQLVRCCEALREVCVAYGVPLISGKDSMKNDSTRGGRKISIPPSVLFSAIGKIDDVGRAVTLEAKAAGDAVYVLGQTRSELAGSQYVHMVNERERGASDQLSSEMAIGGRAPRLEAEASWALYERVEKAVGAGLFRSVHAVGMGGLGAGLALVAMGGELGIEGEIEAIPTGEGMKEGEALFSETPGRFVVTVAPEKCGEFEGVMGGMVMGRVGVVTEEKRVKIVRGGRGDGGGCGGWGVEESMEDAVG